jgi:hypothetical protein
MEKETLTDREVLLLRRKLDLLLRTGKLLMESAADTNRIERNMKRVAAFMGIPEEKLHLDIRWTMIMVNVSDETHSFSKFQKCEKHGINMTTITEVICHGRRLNKTIRWTSMRKSLSGLRVNLVTICLTWWQSVPGLLVAVSVSCSAVTGSRFCSLLFVHLSDSVSERVVSSSG